MMFGKKETRIKPLSRSMATKLRVCIPRGFTRLIYP